MTALPTDVAFATAVRPRRGVRAAQSGPYGSAPTATGPRATTWVHMPRATSNVEVATVLALQARVAEQTRRAEGVRRASADASAARAATPRYEWTPRGLAVLLVLVGAAVAFMLGVLVTAFLAVSNEPVSAGEAPVALRVVVAADAAGR